MYADKKTAITDFEFINDSAEILAVVKGINKKSGITINYQDFVGKILRMSFTNNTSKSIYLLRPVSYNIEDSIIKKFTASVYLLQASNDSVKWEKFSPREPVDAYENDFDTVLPKSTISKIAYLDNNQNRKYLELMIKYKYDSLFCIDTIRIANRK